MPLSGNTAALTPSVGTNFGPTGATPIMQIAVPQTMIATGANTNSLNSLVWTVWNDIYTNSLNSLVWTVWNDIYTNSITITASETLNTTNSSLTTSTMTTNSTIWTAWNNQITATIAAAASNAIGQVMSPATTNAVTTSITTALNNAVWSNWNVRHASREQVQAAQRQAEEARERQARYQADQVRIQAERTLAEKRAEKLLQETLSPAQREELASKGFFTLKTIAKNGEERIYRIRRGRSRNVEQVDPSGNRIKTLCAHPAAPVPDADTMLAQKLMLEGPDSQEEFLRIANHS